MTSSLARFLAAISNPAAVDRPQPLWSWNSDIDEARIDAMLDQFASQGCGGTFNGHAVDGWQPWFDPEMAAAPVGELMRVGGNTITLHAERTHPLHELTPAYLLGGFALHAQSHGFALAAARPLALGWWRDLGRPLACGRLAYAWDLVLAEPAEHLRLRVRLPQWAGDTWRLRLDGGLVAIAAQGESELELPCALLAGQQRLVVEIASGLSGMLGPHHSRGLPGRWTWESAWMPPRAEAPAGESWQVPTCGLTAAPEVWMVAVVQP